MSPGQHAVAFRTPVMSGDDTRKLIVYGEVLFYHLIHVVVVVVF